jgi:Ca-activated chloride channel homolog
MFLVPIPPSGSVRTCAHPVTVTDGRGRAVSGLEKEHFTLFEDNAPQKITHFAAEDARASIGIIFDASDSMGPKLAKRESPLTLS